MDMGDPPTHLAVPGSRHATSRSVRPRWYARLRARFTDSAAGAGHPGVATGVSRTATFWPACVVPVAAIWPWSLMPATL